MTKKENNVNLNLLLGSLFLGYVMVYIDKLSVGISIVSISQGQAARIHSAEASDTDRDSCKRVHHVIRETGHHRC